MEKLKESIKNFAHKAGDTDNQSFMKGFILAIALSCSFFGIIWSLIYYIVFGFGLTMLLPLLFVVIIGVVIIFSHQIADHRPLIYAQLACITWISALIQWSIGSMHYSGLVIAWSFLGPLGAIIFLSNRQSLIWMGMFLVIVIISSIYDPMLLGHPLFVDNQTKNLFYIMNLGTSSVVVFAASFWFIRTIQFERGRSKKLLQKIQTLFGQHVSEEVANKLISNEVKGADSKAHEVTIMFLDIRDFTLFADSRAPKEVATFQNTVFGELINIVRANKGIVNQILGDGILAVFGTPVVTDTHALDAVKAGFVMIEKTKELSEEGKIPPIKLGIGLHTGKVIAGEVGNDFRKFYSLAGSNVIIASRIEQLNKTFASQFLVSETVYEKTKSLDLPATYHGRKELKGISNQIGIYQLA